VQTLLVFSADNGGREDGDFGGNNFPLRGMKVLTPDPTPTSPHDG
jgi:hypothetical protein